MPDGASGRAGLRMVGSTFQCSWGLWSVEGVRNSSSPFLVTGTSTLTRAACLPSVTRFLDPISPAASLWKQALQSEMGLALNRSHGDYRTAISQELKKAGGQTHCRQDVCGGRRLGQMSQEMSQLKLVFWNLLPQQFPTSNLLLHFCSADMPTHAYKPVIPH